MSKKLVAYFSASGVTENSARQLAEITGADLHEIAPAQAYTSADLNWMNKKSRSSVEMNDPASRPALAEAGVQLYAGVTGSADEAARALAAGELSQNADAACDHHGREHGEGHSCGHHSCHE